ncbi:MAG: polysaccharide lyase 8 family protein [bacterium]|nr:polysaccharide lyase 8 family protein [bacterium]
MLQSTLVLVGFAMSATVDEGPQALQRDFEVIKGRIIARYVTTDEAALEKLRTKVTAYASDIRPDGSWGDVDYGDKGRSRWGSSKHLARMRELAAVHHGLAHTGKVDESVKRAAVLSVQHWLEKDLRNPNWWWNEIGVQLTLGPAMLMLGDALTPELRAQGVEVMKRSNWARWTGQNLVWGVTLQIMRGCVEESPAVIQEAYDRMYQEIRIFQPGEESIQVDFSFHQHGSQLYSGGYGLGFAGNGAEFIHHARGTQFAAPEEVVEVMVGYVLDGQQWMMRGTTFDYSAVGREIVRVGKHGGGMLSSAGRLAALGGPRTGELNAYVARMKSGGKDSPLIGNRHFWRSDYMAHHRPEYFASVRLASNRNRRSEICNAEGRKSHHLADGVMYLYRTGKEYYDIFPVWDWQRVPGTTCEQMGWDKKGKVGGNGETAFAGGVSEGGYGLAAMDFRRGALAARKAWFMFDHAVVCLGAGITCASDNPVLTSVNQCHLKGGVVGNGDVLSAGQHELTAPGWVHHDSVGYVFPGVGTVHVANEAQTGAWADIGTGASEEDSRDVFSLWVDHGAKPDEAVYAYIVYPGAAVDDMHARAEAKDIEILVNTPERQAVRHAGLGIIQAAFYQPGVLTLPDGRTVRVDRACLLQVRRTDSGIQLAVSNPVNEPLEVAVELGTPGGATTKTTITLPGGPMAGSTLAEALPGARF